MFAPSKFKSMKTVATAFPQADCTFSANALEVSVGYFYKELPEHSCASLRVRADRSRSSATQVPVDRARAASRV